MDLSPSRLAPVFVLPGVLVIVTFVVGYLLAGINALNDGPHLYPIMSAFMLAVAVALFFFRRDLAVAAAVTWLLFCFVWLQDLFRLRLVRGDYILPVYFIVFVACTLAGLVLSIVALVRRDRARIIMSAFIAAVVVLLIAAFVVVVTMRPQTGHERCVFGAGFGCVDYGFGDAGVAVTLVNALGVDAVDVVITASCAAGCVGESRVVVPLWGNGERFNLFFPYQGEADRVRVSFEIEYLPQGRNVRKTVDGDVTGRVYEELGSLLDKNITRADMVR